MLFAITHTEFRKILLQLFAMCHMAIELRIGCHNDRVLAGHFEPCKLCQLLGQSCPLLTRPGPFFTVQTELGIEILQGLEIGLELFRQFTHIVLFKLAEALFLLLLSLLHLIKLPSQEVRCFHCLPFTRLQVFVDIEGRDGIGDLCRLLWVSTFVTNREGTD